MADAGLIAEVSDALNRAEAEGFQAGYAQATKDFYGENAAFLFANIFADAMVAAAGRLAAHDAGFATQLQGFAEVLRNAVTPPTVSGSSPADGGTVAHDQPVSVTFDTDMAPSSIEAPGALSVAPAAGGAPLNASVAWDALSRTATLTPQNGFTAGVQYKLTVEGVTTTQGRGMPAPFVLAFEAA